MGRLIIGLFHFCFIAATECANAESDAGRSLERFWNVPEMFETLCAVLALKPASTATDEPIFAIGAFGKHWGKDPCELWLGPLELADGHPSDVLRFP